MDNYSLSDEEEIEVSEKHGFEATFTIPAGSKLGLYQLVVNGPGMRVKTPYTVIQADKPAGSEHQLVVSVELPLLPLYPKTNCLVVLENAKGQRGIWWSDPSGVLHHIAGDAYQTCFAGRGNMSNSHKDAVVPRIEDYRAGYDLENGTYYRRHETGTCSFLANKNGTMHVELGERSIIEGAGFVIKPAGHFVCQCGHAHC